MSTSLSKIVKQKGISLTKQVSGPFARPSTDTGPNSSVNAPSWVI